MCVPQEGIYLAMRALLSPGAHVVVTSPCYQVRLTLALTLTLTLTLALALALTLNPNPNPHQSLYEVARSMGCELSHWQPRGLEEGGTPRFDPADLAALVP